jgi:hypothetical protein
MGRIQRTLRQGAVAVHLPLRSRDSGFSGCQERQGLLGVVLQGSEHLGGVDAADRDQLGGRPLQVAALLGEALGGLADAAREAGLLGALVLEGVLHGAKGVHVRPEVTHDGRGQGRLLRVAVGVLHPLLGVEAARDGGFGGLEGAGELVRCRDAELEAREVEFVGGAAHLFVGGQELTVGQRGHFCRVRDGCLAGLGGSLCGGGNGAARVASNKV